MILHPLAHGLHIRNEIGAIGCFPHQRRYRVHVPGAEVGVTRAEPRLQQSLELPGAGPAFVVAKVRRESADQRTLLPFRTQGGIDFPDRSLGRYLRAGPHQPCREKRCCAKGIGFVTAVCCFGHENDIDIADVVQFPPTALAHTDDGEPARKRRFTHLVAGDGQSSFQRRIGEITQPRRHGLHSGQAAEVTNSNAQ